MVLLGFSARSGEGHMAAVIREFTDQVTPSDIFDYGFGKAPHDFPNDGPLTKADWIITNPRPLPWNRPSGHRVIRQSRTRLSHQQKLA
jgi:hypothetical protein